MVGIQKGKRAWALVHSLQSSSWENLTLWSMVVATAGAQSQALKERFFSCIDLFPKLS